MHIKSMQLLESVFKFICFYGQLKYMFIGSNVKAEFIISIQQQEGALAYSLITFVPAQTLSMVFITTTKPGY